MPSHLKNRVRERMAKTGESWAAALRNVRAQATAALAPVEPEAEVIPPAAEDRESRGVDRGTEPFTGTVGLRCGNPDEPMHRDVCPLGADRRGERSPRLVFATAAGLQPIELHRTDRLGRHPKCSIQLLDKIVAPEHCLLERRDGILVLRDLGSLNGTYVNGERVRGERALGHGDEIALGATRARYDDGSGPMRFPPPAISPGAVARPAPGDWRPPGSRGGNGGRGGAPAEISAGAIPWPASPPPRQPS